MDASELIKKEALRRGLSKRTIEIYSYHVNRFLKKCKKDPLAVKKKDINSYLDHLVDKGASGSTLNLTQNSLRFLFCQIMKRRFLLNIHYSKIPKKLPTVLTKNEILKLFNSIENQKHKLMIELLYSSGLRVSEIVKLRIKDLELHYNYGWVREGKGNKDRLFIIAKRLKNKLILHTSELKYNDRLFPGRYDHLNTKTVYDVIKKAGKKANIKKNIHPHTLRHSFATHLIEDGYDVAAVQNLLGHNNPKTTMRYLHMASPSMVNVKSPYDNL